MEYCPQCNGSLWIESRPGIPVSYCVDCGHEEWEEEERQ